MCGIVGFTGNTQAAPILLDGLSKLEYRGYDSAGIAVRNGDNKVEVIKEKGKLKVLIDKTNSGKAEFLKWRDIIHTARTMNMTAVKRKTLL